MFLWAAGAALLLVLPIASAQPADASDTADQLMTALDRYPATTDAGLVDSGMAGMGRLVLIPAGPALQGSAQTGSTASGAIVSATHTVTASGYSYFAPNESPLQKSRLTGVAHSCRAPPCLPALCV